LGRELRASELSGRVAGGVRYEPSIRPLSVRVALGGKFLLIVASLGAIIFLVDRDRGSRFGYLGCETQPAKNDAQGDQAASGMRSPQGGTWAFAPRRRAR
jgi:hypothetical protein